MFTTPWISRLAAVLLLIVAIATVYVFIAEPIIIGYSETDREIEQIRHQLSHLQRLAATAPALAEQVKRSETQQASQGYYLSGGTE